MSQQQNVTRSEVLHVIEAAGFQIVERSTGSASGEELFLDKSPCCVSSEPHRRGDRKMMMNADSGLWNCARCGTGGNLFQFRRLTGQLDMLTPASAYSGTRRGHELSRQEQDGGKRDTPAKIIPMEFVAEMEGALWADNALAQEAHDYLRKGRGFTDETVKRFRFGLTQSHFWKCAACGNDERRRRPGELQPVKCRKCGEELTAPHTSIPLIAIPIFENKKCVLVKYRGVREKAFEREYGCKSPLYGIDEIQQQEGDKRSWRRVFITEAELDRVSLIQYGVDGCVLSLTAGAKGQVASMMNALGPYRADLAAFDEVVLALDNDEPGDACAEACAEILGKHRCFRLKLPLKDANDCLRSGIPASAIAARVEEATSYSVNSVRHISAYRDRLKIRFRTDGAAQSYSSGYESVDRLWGGIRGGEITIITGDTGSGKSMFTKRVALNVTQQLKEHGRAALLASVEDGIDSTMRVLTAMMARRMVDTMTEDEALRVYDELLASLPLYMIGEWTDQSKFDDLLANIEWGVRRYGLWLVVIDHFHWVLDDSAVQDDERFRVEHALRKLKTLVAKTGIHLILVVHPSKLRTTNKGQVIEPDLNDLKGSSEIKKAAFTAFRVWRDRTAQRAEGEQRARALITSLKVRYEGGCEGSVPYWYDTKALDYIPLTKEELEAGKKGGGRKKEEPTARVDLDGKDNDLVELPF